MTVTGLGISNQEHLYNRYEVSTNKQGGVGWGGHLGAAWAGRQHAGVKQ